MAAQALGGLIWAYKFTHEGKAERLPDNLKIEELNIQSGWVWLHFSLADERARRLLRGLEILPEEARDTLLTPDEHLFVEVTDGIVHGIVADLQKDLVGKTDEMGRLHFAFDDRLVISARRRSLFAVDTARKRIDSGVPFQTPVELLEEILHQFALGITSLLRELSVTIDDIEDRLLLDYEPGSDRRRLIPVRRQLVRAHRQLIGLHGLLVRLEETEETHLPDGFIELGARMAQRMISLDHEVIGLQDRTKLLHDEMEAKILSQTNASLNSLSVFTAMLLPPTLVTGFFGMNTKDLPFNQTDNGTFFAFFLCLAAVVGAYWLLRRLGVNPGR